MTTTPPPNSKRTAKRVGIGARPPANPHAEAWIRQGDADALGKGDLYTARLTLRARFGMVSETHTIEHRFHLYRPLLTPRIPRKEIEERTERDDGLFRAHRERLETELLRAIEKTQVIVGRAAKESSGSERWSAWSVVAVLMAGLFSGMAAHLLAKR